MEVSVIGSSQVNLGRAKDVGLYSFSRNLKMISLKGFNPQRNPKSLCCRRSCVGFCLRASASSHAQALVSGKGSKTSRTITSDSMTLSVGLPLDTISTSNTVNHSRAIATGLRALKLLGVDGVELPIWWGIVENEARGKYDWSGYLAIVEIVHKLGLKVHVSLCFHRSQEPKISLPQWVEKIESSDSSIYFTDRSGHQYKGCLSLSVDELPVLEGKTPVEVYREFCESFRASFSSFLGSTITSLSIGLGPDGELRYPSMKGENLDDAGEFQCYDRHLLENLKHQAVMEGNPLWGLGGPHDAHNQSPLSGGFFAENGGSWESPYGEFFLSWYSSQLIHHGDRMLSLAASTFKDVPISLSGKIPLMHSWYKSRSHPAELTAGFYNTEKRDGYKEVAEMFSKHSCMVVIPGFDLSNNSQTRSSPESLLGQITSSCREQGSKVSGVNSTVSGRFDRIKKNLTAASSVVEMFTYQRMGAHFFSPEHFPAFTGFIRGLNQPDQCFVDSALGDRENQESNTVMNLQMQSCKEHRVAV